MIKSCHNGELNSTQYGTRMTGKGNIAGIIQDQFRIAHQLYLKGRSRPEYNLDLHHDFKTPQLKLF